MDVRALVTEVEDDDSTFDFIIDPDVMYPAMIEEILEVIESGDYRTAVEMMGDKAVADLPEDSPPQVKAAVRSWATDRSPIVRMYLPKAMTLPKDAWEAALAPASDAMASEQREARAEALELARMWFTELLHVSIEYKPMSIQILAGDYTYRL
jgi:hypothetical protein